LDADSAPSLATSAVGYAEKAPDPGFRSEGGSGLGFELGWRRYVDFV
jgi:hypothetical protein